MHGGRETPLCNDMCASVCGDVVVMLQDYIFQLDHCLWALDMVKVLQKGPPRVLFVLCNGLSKDLYAWNVLGKTVQESRFSTCDSSIADNQEAVAVPWRTEPHMPHGVI